MVLLLIVTLTAFQKRLCLLPFPLRTGQTCPLPLAPIFLSLKGNLSLSVSSWRVVVYLYSVFSHFLFFHIGTEFKCITCPITGVVVFLEIQHGKEGMKDQVHNHALGATAGCTARMSERCAQLKVSRLMHGLALSSPVLNLTLVVTSAFFRWSKTIGSTQRITSKNPWRGLPVG